MDTPSIWKLGSRFKRLSTWAKDLETLLTSGSDSAIADLSSSSGSLSGLFESTSSGVFRKSPSGTVTFHNRYQIQRRLGGGGFGEVYLAEDMNLGVEVALKFIKRGCDNPLQIENFQTEGRRLARLCNQLNDPCVCRVWDCDFDEALNVHFIAMKYYPSGTFQDLLSSHASQVRKTAVNPRYVALLAKQLARTLHRIHEAGIIHRDLKPANILLGENGRPVITDFGIAWSNEDFFEFIDAGTPPLHEP